MNSGNIRFILFILLHSYKELVTYLVELVTSLVIELVTSMNINFQVSLPESNAGQPTEAYEAGRPSSTEGHLGAGAISQWSGSGAGS